MTTDPRFIAFNREAELAKRLTCSGLTALRKATPARPGIYYDAFFGLSIGLERLAKLAWLIDECIGRNGTFPTDKDLRSVGHDIQTLVKRAQLIQRGQSVYSTLPSDSITDHIIMFLSEFAKGTRYYNIDFFVGGKSKGMGDPIKAWHEKVGAAVLALPQMRAKRQRWRAQSQEVASLMSPAVVFATAADGTSLSTVAELSISETKASEINKQAQWKILTIVRYLSLLIANLTDAAHAAGHTFIPDMREHFGFFCGDDAILHRYTTWPPRDVR
jgi:hypothetical protein